jgi:hypothetical protein
VVATGEIGAADRLVLESYAKRTADRVWALSPESVLAAVAAGRSTDHLREFLLERAAQPELPAVLLRLLEDVGDRAGRLRDLGRVRLIECADPALAALISHDRRLRALCRAIGERHLAVAVDDEPAFHRALHALGMRYRSFLLERRRMIGSSRSVFCWYWANRGAAATICSQA